MWPLWHFTRRLQVLTSSSLPTTYETIRLWKQTSSSCKNRPTIIIYLILNLRESLIKRFGDIFFFLYFSQIHCRDALYCISCKPLTMLFKLFSYKGKDKKQVLLMLWSSGRLRKFDEQVWIHFTFFLFFTFKDISAINWCRKYTNWSRKKSPECRQWSICCSKCPAGEPPASIMSH